MCCILFYSILLTLLINQSNKAQIEIEEELQLDETKIEATNLTMPFYGKISGCVNWGAMWNGWLKRVVIRAGGQTVNMGFNCGSAGWLNCSWVINNLPKGTSINITVYGSCVNNQLVESETRIIQTGNNEYDIMYYSYLGNWQRATTLKFIPTQPPNCPIISINCDNDTSKPFDIELVEKDNDWANLGECNKKRNTLAFFTPLSDRRKSNIFEFTTNQVEICFDRQTQKINYKLLTKPTLVVVIDICNNNAVSRDLVKINSLSELQSLQNYNCNILLKSVSGHYKYPVELYNGYYLFTEILILHERIHKEKFFNDYIMWHKNALYYFITKWDKNCSSFNSLTEAKLSALDHSQKAFEKYWQGVFLQYLWWEGLDDKMPEDYRESLKNKMEEETHNDPRIHNLLNIYKNEIIKKCDF